MTTFAQVKNGTVISVIVAEQDYIDTLPVEENVEWVKTDPQTMCNKHYDLDNKLDSGTPLRGNYATVGGLYDKEKDIFCGPKPGTNWKLNDKYYRFLPDSVPNYILGGYNGRSSGDKLDLHIDSFMPYTGD